MAVNLLRRYLPMTVAVMIAYVTGHLYPRPLYYTLYYCVPGALNPMIVKRRREPAFIGGNDDAENEERDAIVETKNLAYREWLYRKMNE